METWLLLRQCWKSSVQIFWDCRRRSRAKLDLVSTRRTRANQVRVVYNFDCALVQLTPLAHPAQKTRSTATRAYLRRMSCLSACARVACFLVPLAAPLGARCVSRPLGSKRVRSSCWSTLIELFARDTDVSVPATTPTWGVMRSSRCCSTFGVTVCGDGS